MILTIYKTSVSGHPTRGSNSSSFPEVQNRRIARLILEKSPPYPRLMDSGSHQMVHNWKTPRQKLHGKHMKTHSTIFFRQLCLVLGMMEINSNLSSKYCELVVRVTRVTMHQPSKDPMSRAKLRHPIHTIYGGSILLNNVRNVRNPLFMYRDFYIYLHD